MPSRYAALCCSLSRSSCNCSVFPSPLNQPPSPRPQPLLPHTARARLEQQYTQTLFYLAQALGKLGDDAGSAEYCGTCLRRQLEESGGAGGVNRESWRQNTAQLAMFYTNQEKYATAQYCLAAATARAPPRPTAFPFCLCSHCPAGSLHLLRL